MIIEDVLAFLKQVPSFQFLDDDVLGEVANNLSLEFYPAGMVILKQDGPASDSLRIVKKGTVKVSVRSDDGEDMVVDFRGTGDTFGLLSLLGSERQKTTIEAVEDTICYLLNRETVRRLIDGTPAFTEYVLQQHFTKYIDKTYREMHNKSLFYGSSDHLLFTTHVGDIAARDIVTIPERATVQDAAQVMSKHRISSIIVVDGTGAPIGIATDRDLREKVVAEALDVLAPVRSIMSRPLIQVDAKDHCFEAVLRMIKYNIHHVLVSREGSVRGVLTNHDLMLLQGTSPLSLAKDIESQQGIEGLAAASKKIDALIGLLVKEGARAGNIMRIISEINDRLVRKVITLAERASGPPPVPYCWVVFGSAGRLEQTFRTDQDTAIIHADPESDREAAEAERYFDEFSRSVTEGLAQAGFAPCPAGFMASSPAWRRPLKAWKRALAEWVSAPTPAAPLNVPAFFDLRPVYGDLSLAENLRTHGIGMVRDRKPFLEHLADRALRNAPPIGFFKSFAVEKGGAHENELDLKEKGIFPLVDGIRLFALERGVRETSTLERISALRQSHPIVKPYADELRHSFELIMLLRIHQQFSRMSEGGVPDGFLDPQRLSNLEKRSLKDAFHLTAKMQDLIVERYRSMVW